MMQFSEYAKHKDGTYVSVDLSAQHRDALDEFVEHHLGLDERVDQSTYHTTIIYSRTPVPSADLYIGAECTSSARVVGYEVFPTKNDGRCLVMRLDFPFAELLNKQLTAEGATSDYAEYKPHLTLAYNTKQHIDPQSLPLPSFELKFDPVKVEGLNVDFVPSNK